MRKIPFADFTVMHNEIREDLDAAYRRVMDSNYFISFRVICFLEKV